MEQDLEEKDPLLEEAWEDVPDILREVTQALRAAEAVTVSLVEGAAAAVAGVTDTTKQDSPGGRGIHSNTKVRFTARSPLRLSP